MINLGASVTLTRVKSLVFWACAAVVIAPRLGRQYGSKRCTVVPAWGRVDFSLDRSRSIAKSAQVSTSLCVIHLVRSTTWMMFQLKDVQAGDTGRVIISTNDPLLALPFGRSRMQTHARERRLAIDAPCFFNSAVSIRMDRRHFIVTSTAVASTAILTSGAASAAPARTGSDDITAATPDGLNPPGIRTAGVRMLPVVGGK